MPPDDSRPLLSTKPSIDNPDQRITQDVDSLCRSLSTIIPLVVISPFTIGYYAYRTWQLTGYYGPLSIVIYFIVWTGLNKIFISAVSRTIFRQNIHKFEHIMNQLHFIMVVHLNINDLIIISLKYLPQYFIVEVFKNFFLIYQ
jgi:hypothetical protein